MVTIIVAVLTALAGFVFGRAKTFFEGKQRAYEEIIPIILKTAYDYESKDEEAFNKALAKIWLFGSREAAIKMDHAVSIMIKPSRGNITSALQEAVAEMRKDIQSFFFSFSFRQTLSPEEVKHLYVQIANVQVDEQEKKRLQAILENGGEPD